MWSLGHWKGSLTNYKTVILQLQEVYNDLPKQAFEQPLSIRLDQLPVSDPSTPSFRLNANWSNRHSTSLTTMRLQRVIGSLAAFASLTTAVDLTGYEYVVVGSGAGGGYLNRMHLPHPCHVWSSHSPLAARLALAGHKTLLIEAGDDQGANVNYTVPAYNAKVSEDPSLAWNFFVKHYADEERQARDFKTSYQTPDGGSYTGLNPPAGSEMKGTLYPRTGTLGGCTAHNALIAVYPHRSGA
jgi:choline dehydrogenase